MEQQALLIVEQVGAADRRSDRARPSTGWISDVLGQVSGVLLGVETLIKTLNHALRT